MQTATVLCDAQHDASMLVHIVPFVKSMNCGVMGCPVYGDASSKCERSVSLNPWKWPPHRIGTPRSAAAFLTVAAILLDLLGSAHRLAKT